ncbi:MAG: insulinase family protein, partial [Pseudomonadota bacterium]|nr:insulinase family protein [Pseudomonadota bacterium]
MRRRLVSLAAILSVIAPASSVWALSPDSIPAPVAIASALPQAAPLQGAPVADLVARVDIPWSRFQLDNGLTVVVHEDRKAPVVAVSIWYNVGSKDEPAGSTGFAHLFEHLMFGGSENSPTSHIQAM